MKRETVAALLRDMADRVESGNCTMTPGQIDAIVRELNNPPMSKEQARVFLGMSRSNFDRLVREGLIPHGHKVRGITNLIWYREELRKVRLK